MHQCEGELLYAYFMLFTIHIFARVERSRAKSSQVKKGLCTNEQTYRKDEQGFTSPRPT